jgi:hypothetical protein
MQTAESNPIQATQVLARSRLSFLPKYFGASMLVFEHAVYNTLGNMCAEYTGGMWEFVELSNGGAYMKPQQRKYKLACDGNGYECEVSEEAAGIIACLMALSHLSFEYQENETLCEMLADRFHQLRDYAGNHPEAGDIFAAID